MARRKTGRCKTCGRLMQPGELLSWTVQCPECGERAQIENKRELVAHHGPHFEHWRRRIAASVGASLDGHRERA
jgi:predicted RNA-binding Zn-ribbon protein involved in translation (DUF1610 family)